MSSNAARERFYRNHGLWTDQRLGLLPGTAAARWPDREFASAEGMRISYGEFWCRVLVAAHDLVDRGLRPNDLVLMQVANSLEILVLQFAAWRVGAVCVPIVPLYRQHELSMIVNELRPAMVAVSATLGSRSLVDEMESVITDSKLEPLARYLIGGDHRPGWCRIPPLGEGKSDERGLPEPTEANECCLILYTSGSTSAPKGARLTSRAILSNSTSYRLHHGLSSEMVTLAASPLSHVAALCTGIINPMCVGGRAVIMATWKPNEAIELIEREKISHFGTVVTYLQDLVDRYEGGAGGSHRLSIVSVGGAPTPAALIARADAVGIKAINQYGMTEIACNATLGLPTDALEMRSVYAGKCMFGTEIQAVNVNRKPLAPGETGELRIRSPQMMLGYTTPQQSAESLEHDGWYYTGDVGSVTNDGWLRITGRIKDVINRGGEKFSAQDIEMAIMSYPGIAIASVIGAPDSRFGEVVAAFIQTRPNVAWEGPELIVAHLEKMRLARSKFPVIWVIVDDFPRTATNKVFKPGLVALLPKPKPLL